ncbi:MAG TPA: glycerol kinase GlpK [Candidatus Thermoplasmatota archaeon]|nr:glycerol kinase GlpK [Candidatus Thermoplasmatota archaeon]
MAVWRRTCFDRGAASPDVPGHVVAVDEGTTGVTVLVLDPRRRVVGRAYREIACRYPKPGWVEQDAEEVWTATRLAIVAALKAARLRHQDVAAVGIANQRETTVLWDRRTGRPVAPAIVWQDRRTAARCRELQPQWQDAVRAKTGLVIDPYFSATKLEWLLRDRRLKDRASAGRLAFGTIDSWLACMLTGRHVTDPTNASRTLLWDIKKGTWDGELLQLFGVPEAVLPEVVPSSHAFGSTGRLWSADVPVASLVGDQQAALFGNHCLSAGEAKNTYGTGCFALQHTGGRAVTSRHGLLTTRAAQVDKRAQFALEGSVFVAGAAIQWLRDALRLVKKASDVDSLASQVEDSGGAYLVPAFTGLGAPHWDPEARGALVGLTRGTDRRHLARAVLDSIAFQATDVILAMEKDSGIAVPRLRVDGGAAKSAPLLQTQADLLQRPVVRPANVETTAMGAGLLAGLAVDAWTMKDLKGGSSRETEVTPRMRKAEAERRMEAWHAAVAAARSFKPG